jgi:hypothetical protein
LNLQQNKQISKFMDNKNFFVQLPNKATDPRGFYKAGLIEKLNKYPWLKVAGLDSPFTTPSGRDIRGIEYAGADHVLTFGTAKYHDVNWAKRTDFVREKGYAPVLDIVKDWSTVVTKLDAFAQARKPRPVYNPYYTRNTGDIMYVGGQKVEVFDNYIKIGYNIIPRTANTNTFYAYTPAQLEAIRTIVVTVKYNY